MKLDLAKIVNNYFKIDISTYKSDKITSNDKKFTNYISHYIAYMD